jgi:hypothetical protein
MRCTTCKTRLRLEVLEGRRTPSDGVIDLGALSPSAVNNADVVVGSVNGHAAVERYGVLTDLGTLGGASSAAKDINFDLSMTDTLTLSVN